MQGSCQGKMFVFAELLQKCRLPSASLLPITSFHTQTPQFARLFQGLTAHLPVLGKGILDQVLQCEFTSLTKKMQAPKKICLIVWAFLKCFCDIQHCRRLFCSPNPPPSPIMTEREPFLYPAIFTNRNNRIAFRTPLFLPIWLSSAKGFTSSGLGPVRHDQLHCLGGSMSLMSRGWQVRSQQSQQAPLQLPGCFCPFVGSEGWSPDTTD